MDQEVNKIKQTENQDLEKLAIEVFAARRARIQKAELNETRAEFYSNFLSVLLKQRLAFVGNEQDLFLLIVHGFKDEIAPLKYAKAVMVERITVEMLEQLFEESMSSKLVIAARVMKKNPGLFFSRTELINAKKRARILNKLFDTREIMHAFQFFVSYAASTIFLRKFFVIEGSKSDAITERKSQTFDEMARLVTNFIEFCRFEFAGMMLPICEGLELKIEKDWEGLYINTLIRLIGAEGGIINDGRILKDAIETFTKHLYKAELPYTDFDQTVQYYKKIIFPVFDLLKPFLPKKTRTPKLAPDGIRFSFVVHILNEYANSVSVSLREYERNGSFQ